MRKILVIAVLTLTVVLCTSCYRFGGSSFRGGQKDFNPKCATERIVHCG